MGQLAFVSLGVHPPRFGPDAAIHVGAVTGVVDDQHEFRRARHLHFDRPRRGRVPGGKVLAAVRGILRVQRDPVPRIEERKVLVRRSRHVSDQNDQIISVDSGRLFSLRCRE